MPNMPFKFYITQVFKINNSLFVHYFLLNKTFKIILIFCCLYVSNLPTFVATFLVSGIPGSCLILNSSSTQKDSEYRKTGNIFEFRKGRQIGLRREEVLIWALILVKVFSVIAIIQVFSMSIFARQISVFWRLCPGTLVECRTGLYT